MQSRNGVKRYIMVTWDIRAERHIQLRIISVAMNAWQMLFNCVK